jgi:hypothetical protein
MASNGNNGGNIASAAISINGIYRRRRKWHQKSAAKINQRRNQAEKPSMTAKASGVSGGINGWRGERNSYGMAKIIEKIMAAQRKWHRQHQ